MSNFMVRCFNEENETMDYIAETAKSYGAKILSVDILPKHKNFGRLQVKSNVPDFGQLVYLCKDGVPLESFKHPDQATYMIGKNAVSKEFLPKHAIKLKVNTPVEYPLWNFVALALALDDRNKKNEFTPDAADRII